MASPPLLRVLTRVLMASHRLQLVDPFDMSLPLYERAATNCQLRKLLRYVRDEDIGIWVRVYLHSRSCR